MNLDTRIETERFYDMTRLAFGRFLDSDRGTDAQKEVINVLKDIERTFKKFGGIKQTKDKGIWLRFHTDDTLATTIRDVERNINRSTTTDRNYQHMMECLGIAIMPESGLQLHFS